MTETDLTDIWDGDRLAGFRRRLRQWYRKEGRTLPWRESADAYRVWISEIMLQQTTVAAVIPYFERFLQRFPTVHELAAAEETDVLRLWEGLGYYSRARNIHRTAKIVAHEFGGTFPDDVSGLLELPGIGRYTAGAIVSFAYDCRAPIVEANTLRLYCRLLGFDGDPRTAAGQKLLWAFAECLVPRKKPGEFNQALMDLGATVCRVTEPDCPSCPVRDVCGAFAENRVQEIPRAARRPKTEDVTEAAVVVRKNGRVLLRRCQPGERWAGLWDFPRFELEENGEDVISSPTVHRTVELSVRETTGVKAEVDSFLDEIRHGVTRFRIRLLCYVGQHRGGTLKRSSGLKWVSVRDLSEYPLSVTGRKIAGLIAKGR